MALNVHDICPNCGEVELTQVKNELRCRKCGYKTEIFDTEDAQWLKDYNSSAKLWDNSLFPDLPALIGHEYSRLKWMFERGMVYAGIVQIKDVFEVTMKFAILCAASYLKDLEITAELVRAPLSVGGWENILDKLAKVSGGKMVYDTLPISLQHILLDFKKLNVNKSIFGKDRRFSSWRNEFLGHGALGFSAGEKYQKSLTGMSKGLAEHFAACREDYRAIKILLDGQPLAHTDLNYGRKLAEGRLTISIDGEPMDIKPFAVRYEDGVYLFDALNKGKSYALNYVNANKRQYSAPYFNDVLNAAKSKFSLSSEGIARDFTEVEFEHQLNKLNEAYNFVKPKYIEDWIKGCVCDTIGNSINPNCLSKGIIHLMMERGMGKTSVAFALDDQYSTNAPINLSDTVVRVFYCSRIQLRSMQEFADGLRNELKRGAEAHNGKNFPILNIEIANKSLEKMGFKTSNNASNMAKFLRDFRDIHDKELHHGSKLMLVIDGLDEIPQECMEIFDFIPTGEMLEDNIYIMLTSRNPETEQLAPEISRRISAIRADSRLSVLRHGDDSATESNKAVLRQYIAEMTDTHDDEYQINLTSDEVERLIELSDNTFLNLTMYLHLVKSGYSVESLDKMDNATLLKFYMERLREVYGVKMFMDALKVLAVILTAQESLTLEEISALSGRGEVDMMLLAYMKDLAPFIKSIHASEKRGVNEYTSANESYTRYITDIVTDTYAEMVESYRQMLLDFNKEDCKDENGLYHVPDAISYLAANIGKFIGKYSDNIDNLLDKLDIISSAMEYEGTFFKIERRINIYTCKGNICRDIDRYDDAIVAYNDCIKLMEYFIAQGRYYDGNNLAVAYMNRGNVYQSIGKYAEAQSDYDKCIKIMSWLHAHGKIDANDLATAYMNRGITYYTIGKYGEALSDYLKCMEIRGRLYKQGKLYDLGDLASVMLNTGILFADNHEDEAIDIFNQAIAMLEIEKELSYSAHDTLQRLYYQRDRLTKQRLILPQIPISF